MTVEYSDLCANPRKVLADVAALLKRHGASVSRVGECPKHFDIRGASDSDDADYAAVVRAAARRGQKDRQAMSSWRLISAHEPRAWAHALNAIGHCDVYHLREYHLVQSDLSAGEPFLFAVESSEGRAVVPFHIRPVHKTARPNGDEVHEATSAYGYPGALASVQGDATILRREFQMGLREALHQLGVARMSLRQHPLFWTDWLFEEMAEVVPLGRTVAINLGLSERAMRRQTRKSHRTQLNKTSRLGISVRVDRDLAGAPLFKALYDATMKRNRAASHYFLPGEYYEELRHRLGGQVAMFHGEVNDEPTSSVLVLMHDGIVQYHLGATADGWERSGALRYVLDQVRLWAKEQGFRWLHLGGGLGSRDDSLFQFKSGFSRTFFRYRVIRSIAPNAATDSQTGKIQ